MNLEYLNTLPEVENKYKVELEDDEKVVFTAKLSTFGTEKDRMLGTDSSTFTLTNKRIIAHNDIAIWTIDILEDVVSCKKVEGKFLFVFNSIYFAVDLNKEVIFGEPKEKLTGYRFYFNKGNTAKFEEIVNKAFN